MLCTKPQGHWPFGSGEECFWRFFIIYGRGGHLSHVPPTHGGSTCNLTSTGPGVLEKKIFENDGRTTDGRRSMPILSAHQ